MLELVFTYLINGEVCLVSIHTDGVVASVQEILDENGDVPVSLDWVIINELEMYALCMWMDAQSTHYISGEIH
jgi:hypothetical protein